ncbi:cobalt ECF transporter T component CbiQ [Gordonia hydrophobica]|uniref:Cobalt ECF transporter T component CbiQ n=1 Tax=Gordonia hydrophobica TaxID=40516 RepID=A0ABZ2U4X5_9ACTN|nr:cobalt ECF transporter T component CbiQ [Gordonia hydrophobica]MBM7368612.1 cobalt/nickel transport system permease protein [Gordonia hydrophobica]
MGLSISTVDTVAWRSTWRQRSVAEKTALYGGVVVAALLLPPWPTAPLLFVLCLSTTKFAGVPISHLLRCLRAPAVFISLAAASTALTLEIAPWRLGVDASDVVRAVGLAARALTASAATLMFASTTPMTAIAAALRRIRVPAACVDIVTVMYRLVFVLIDSLTIIRQAQVSRLGYVNLRRSLSSSAMLTAAVLTRAWTHARRLEVGLASRDFGTALPMLDTPAVAWRFVAMSGGLLGTCAVISLMIGAG